MPHSTVLEDSFTVPAAKRRKTTHQTSSPNSGSISDEVLDRLGPQGVTFGSSQIASQAPSAHSQEIGIQIKRGGSSTGSLTEHKSVERMMNSDPITKKKARRANSQIQQYHHGLPIPLPSISTASQPIDISGEDDEDIMDSEPTVTLPKPLYRGTARVPPSKENAVNTSRLFQTGDTLRRTSPYFTNRFSVENRTDGTRNHGSVESQIPKRTENQSGRLASKFVFESGARRGSGFHLSSDRDELDQTGNTVRPPADARAFSPTKQARRSSPSKGSSSTRKAESDAEQQDGLDRSTIKHSTWLSPEPKDASDVRNIGGRIRDGESKPPLDFELAAISVCESLLHGNDWALVHDASNESYRVQKSGRFFTARNSSLRIDPEKLQKIDFGTSGGKVRFSSSKSGNDDYVLDLQFRKEKDTAAIVKRLSNACSGKVTSHERYAFRIKCVR